ncbi:MFS transporter [Antrihabitans cavernicola]|uniref:MFS transporter n=1 Tax=Antrihabitans cavernicola TaxID=2495913 RepID=A0A5A7SH25_9NOCA|nr:MFS transporter [Spelaeibacter cavernicola]KAA0024689.1 MFS transporter [Spelaeibacter cavernicola]
MRSLGVRAVAFYGVRDLIPLYALYTLLFADHGLSTAQISSLLVIWSVTGFVFEVPSGAWADTVSRRGLLILGSVLLAAGFAVWTVFPSYAGFATGFVLWGISGALQSGTYEALLYDELQARDATTSYASLMGYANSAAETCNLLATVAAAPLFALGGYPLVGWVSVGVAVGHGALALSLPSAPKAMSVVEESDVGPPSGYVAMLRAGLGEVLRVRTVRFGVLLVALLFGFTAFDEYFALLANEAGVATATVPLLIGLTVIGQVIGTALAGRTAKMRSSTMAIALIAAGVLLTIGSLIGGRGLLGVIGFASIGVGYGIVNNAVIVAEARVQDAIAGPARATVTSASGLLSEVVALAIFGAVALGSEWLSMATMLAVLGVPVVLAAAAVPKWLPGVRADPPETAEVRG